MPTAPTSSTPILMLTARDTESDKVIGLESGADDYLTKPFGVRELMARVGAITRRHGARRQRRCRAAADGGSRDVRLDADRREAIVRATPVELTRQEFDLLHQLAQRPGIVFSRAALLQNVWSDDTYVTERTVDTVISRLRRKIERDPQDPELILTAWGVGYKFARLLDSDRGFLESGARLIDRARGSQRRRDAPRHQRSKARTRLRAPKLRALSTTSSEPASEVQSDELGSVRGT